MKNYNKLFESLKKLNNSNEEKQERGRRFEKMINDIFEDEGVLLRRSYQTIDNKSEQIDGAIQSEKLNRIVLFEVKWVESNIAASVLYSFIGKVENKFVGTIGLFISKEKLSDNFIKALNRGRRQTVMIIHGDDIDKMLKNEIRFIDYIDYSLKLLSIDNLSYVPVDKYIENQKIEETRSKSSNKTDKDKISKLILSENDNYPELLKISNKPNNAKDEVFLYFLKNYDSIVSYTYQNKLNENIIKNLKNFIITYYSSVNYKPKFTKEFFHLYLSKDKHTYFNNHLLVEFAKHYNLIEEDERKKIEDRILKLFNKVFGDYDFENYITEMINMIWDNIQIENKKCLIELYFEIFVSFRKDNYPQKQFANRLFVNDEDELINEVVDRWLVSKYKSKAKLEEKLPQEFQTNPIHLIADKTSTLINFLGLNNINELEEYINERVD
jgi:hypothetical protein